MRLKFIHKNYLLTRQSQCSLATATATHTHTHTSSHTDSFTAAVTSLSYMCRELQVQLELHFVARLSSGYEKNEGPAVGLSAFLCPLSKENKGVYWLNDILLK